MSERSYLDGVPLRLTSKFYPQPRPQFKEIDIHIPVDALQEDYDFSLERSVLVEVKAWDEHLKIEKERRAEEARRLAEEEAKRAEEAQRLAEEEAKRAEEERVLAEEEAKKAEEARLVAEEEARKLAEEKRIVEEEEEKIRFETEEKLRIEEEKTRIETEERLKLEEVEKLRLQELENKFKEEERIRLENEEKVRREEERLRKEEEKKLKEQEQLRLKNIKKNLSDFESDTANPFDNVELKSINEMEMLASVLKNDGLPTTTTTNSNTGQNQSYRSDSLPTRNIINSQYIGNGPQVPQNYANAGHQQQYPTAPTMAPYPTPYNAQQQTQHWNHPPNNYFLSTSPSAPDMTVNSSSSVMTNAQISIPCSTTTTNGQQPPPQIPLSSSNSFTNYYFPLLTSMTDSRSMRDRFPNLNQNYGSSQNPYLSANCSPVQHFPILGALSQPPTNHHHHHQFQGISRAPMSFNPNNPILNGQLPHDSVLKTNPNTPPTGTHNTLH